MTNAQDINELRKLVERKPTVTREPPDGRPNIHSTIEIRFTIDEVNFMRCNLPELLAAWDKREELRQRLFNCQCNAQIYYEKLEGYEKREPELREQLAASNAEIERLKCAHSDSIVGVQKHFEKKLDAAIARAERWKSAAKNLVEILDNTVAANAGRQEVSIACDDVDILETVCNRVGEIQDLIASEQQESEA